MSVRFDVKGHVVTITFAGENEYNPITVEMHEDLCKDLRQYDEDPNLWACILTGGGDTNFSAGGNLKRQQMGEEGGDSTELFLKQWWYPKSVRPMSPTVMFRPELNYQPMKPVIAAIRGYCLGAALVLVGQTTDIRIAGASAKFGFTEIKRGLGGGAVARSRLVRQIPYTTLMWMTLTGESIDARTALQHGLVNEVVPDDMVLPRALEVADLICTNSPIALRAEKEVLLRSEDMSFSDMVVFSGAVSTLNRMGFDAREGVRAFNEKRKPKFRGT